MTALPSTSRLTSLRSWATRRQRALALAGATAAAGMVVLWTVVVPDKAGAASGLQALLVRWAHPASWAFLCGYGVAMAVGVPKAVRDPLAWAALASYGAFLLALAL